MKKLIQSKKRGSAITLAVVVVLILLAMGTGLLRLGLNSRIFSIRTASDIAARSAADAGLTKALFEMNEKLKVDTWDSSSLPQAIVIRHHSYPAYSWHQRPQLCFHLDQCT